MGERALVLERETLARLAAATLGGPGGRGSKTPWPWLVEDYGRIRDLIERVFDDFEDFNARVAVPGGFRLRNTASERVWATASGKAGFVPHAVPRDTPSHRARQRVRGTVVFTLLTTRSHDQYNTTIYGMDDRYRGVFGQRRVVFIHPGDIRALGLRDGAWVDLVTVWDDGQERRNLAAYYPETNPLVPLSATALGAGTPTSKSIPVVVLPHQGAAADGA